MCDLQVNQVQLVFRALLVRKGFRETFVTVCLFSDVTFAVGMLFSGNYRNMLFNETDINELGNLN